MRQLPHTPNLDTTLKVFLSSSYLQFTTGIPDVRSFRYTNEALFGALFDNNSQTLGLLHAGVGSFGGGPVKDKTFPIPSQLGNLPLVGPLLEQILHTNTDRKAAPMNPFVLTTWRNYRQIPGRFWYGGEYTTPDDESIDIHDYARTMVEGPASHADIYVSMATVLDNLYFLGPRHGKFENLRYRNAATLRPRDITYGEHGDIQRITSALDPFITLLNPDDPFYATNAVVFKGFHHLDITGGAPIQNDGQPEKVSQNLVQFGIANTSN